MYNTYTRIDKDTVAIITHTKGMEVAIYISPEDVDLVLPYRWCIVTTSPGRCYAMTSYFDQLAGRRKNIYMHRLLLGNPKCCDHQDGNGLNNRRSNIRAVSHKENLQKQELDINRINFDKKIGKYKVWHTLQRKYYYFYDYDAAVQFRISFTIPENNRRLGRTAIVQGETRQSSNRSGFSF